MIIPVGFGQATIVYAGTQAPTGAVNTLGFENVTLDDAQSIANSIEARWSEHIMPLLNDDIELNFVHVKLGPQATGPSATSGSGDPGLDVGPGASPQVAYLISKSTALGGRKGRGRLFLPGVDESSVDQQGLVGSGQVTALQAGFDALIIDLVTDGTPPVLLHNDATTPTDIDDFIVEQTVATIRKRVRR